MSNLKGIVVEKGNGYSVLLLSDGTFRNVEDNDSYELGSVIHIKDTIRHSSRYLNKAVSMVAAVFLVAFLSLGVFAWVTPVQYISIDINPSLELKVNYLDRIINVQSLNDDGKELIRNISVKSLHYESGVNEVIEKAKDLGYLEDKRDVLISISSSDIKRNEKVERNIKGKLDEEVTVLTFNAEEHRISVEEGLSPGKSDIIEKVIESDTQLSKEELAAVPVKDLMEKIKENSSKKDGEVAKHAAKEIEKTAKHAAKEIEREAKKIEKEAKQLAEKMKQEAKQEKEESKRIAKEKAEEAKQLAKEMEKEAKQKKEESKWIAKEKGEEAKQLAEKMKQEAKQKKEESKRIAKEKAEEAKQLAEEIEQEAKQIDEEFQQWTKQKEEEFKKWAKEKEEETKKMTKKEQQEAKRWLKQKEKELKQRLKEEEKEFNRRTKESEAQFEQWTKQRMEEFQQWAKQRMEEFQRWTEQKDE